MIDLSNIKNYYIACGYTDLRCGIDYSVPITAPIRSKENINSLQ